MAELTQETKQLLEIMKSQSVHQFMIEKFMEKADQELPDKPTIPSTDVRYLRAKLILEEALETINALGFEISVDFVQFDEIGDNIDSYREITIDSVQFDEIGDNIDIIEVVDGCADLSVVTIGTLSAFGIKDKPLLEEVDKSNLAKFETPICPECNRTCTKMYFGGKEVYECHNKDCIESNHPKGRRISKGPYKREDGKWIKPSNWQPPNILQVLKDQGYEDS